MKEDEFHKILKSKFDDYEMQINENSWSAIEDELGAVSNNHLKRNILRPIHYVMAASIVLLLSIGGAFIWTNQSLETDHVADNPVVTIPVPDSLTTTDDKMQEQAIVSENEKTIAPIFVSSSVGNKKVDKTSDPVKQQDEKIIESQYSEINEGDEGEVKTSNAIKKQDDKKPTEKNNSFFNNNNEDDIHIVKSKKQNNLALGLNFSSMSAKGGSESSNAIYDTYIGAGTPVIFSIPQPLYNEENHNMPITAGVSLRKNLNNYLAVETGLTYTYLNSTFKSDYSTDKQQLHYIGIPVNFVVKAKQWGDFSIYLSGGGAVKKNIAGRFISENKMNNNQKIVDKSYTTKTLQWSVDASVGFDYQFINPISIYAEPGWSYYFRNSNSLKTIWTKQPSQFSFQFGLRLNIN